MIKEAGAHGVAAPLTLPHRCLRAARSLLLLSPSRQSNFLLLLLCSFIPQFSNYFLSFSLLLSVFCFPPPNRKPHHEQRKEQEPKKPHIKKPLNAFMLYMKEMRANVVAECTLKESAAINQILGRRVGQIVGVASYTGFICLPDVVHLLYQLKSPRDQQFRPWPLPIPISWKKHKDSSLY